MSENADFIQDQMDTLPEKPNFHEQRAFDLLTEEPRQPPLPDTNTEQSRALDVMGQDAETDKPMLQITEAQEGMNHEHRASEIIADSDFMDGQFERNLREKKLDPQTALKAKKLAKELELNEQFVHDNYDQLKDLDTEGFNKDEFMKHSPLMKNWLAESPLNAALFEKKDLSQLSYWERQLRYIGDQTELTQLGVDMNKIHKLQYLNIATEEDERKLEAMRIRQQQLGNIHYDLDNYFEYLEKAPGDIIGYLPQLIESFKLMGTGAALGAAWGKWLGPKGVGAGAAAGAFSGMVADTVLEETYGSYGELKDIEYEDGTKIHPAVARGGAAAVGVINGVIEAVVIGKIAKRIPWLRKMSRMRSKQVFKAMTRSRAVRELMKEMALGAVGEGFEEYLQTLVQGVFKAGLSKAWEKENEGKGARDMVELFQSIFTPELLEEAKKAAIKATKIGGSVVLVAHTPSTRKKWKMAKRNRLRTEEMKKIEKGMPKDEIKREAVEMLFDNIAEGKEYESLYMDVETFDEYFQSKDVDPKDAAQELFGSTEEYLRASQSGSMIKIPFSKYVSRVSPSEHADFFDSEIRFELDEKNYRETMEDLEAETKFNENLELISELERQEMMDEIYQTIREEMLEMGIPSFQAKNVAWLPAAFFETLAREPGFGDKTPLELWRDKNVRIRFANFIGERMEAIVDRHETVQTEKPLPDTVFSPTIKSDTSLRVKDTPKTNLDYLSEFYRGLKKSGIELVNKHTKKKLEVNRKGLEKRFRSHEHKIKMAPVKYDAEIQALGHLESLWEEAVYLSQHWIKKVKKEIPVYNFVVPTLLDGKPKMVKISTTKNPDVEDGMLFHDLEIADFDNEGKSPQFTQEEFLSKVANTKGKTYFQSVDKPVDFTKDELGFYQVLAKALETRKLSNGKPLPFDINKKGEINVEQFIKAIEGNKIPGLKKEEVELNGILDFLKDGLNPFIFKNRVKDFTVIEWLQKKGPQIQEFVYGLGATESTEISLERAAEIRQNTLGRLEGREPANMSEAEYQVEKLNQIPPINTLTFKEFRENGFAEADIYDLLPEEEILEAIRNLGEQIQDEGLAQEMVENESEVIFDDEGAIAIVTLPGSNSIVINQENQQSFEVGSMSNTGADFAIFSQEVKEGALEAGWFRPLHRQEMITMREEGGTNEASLGFAEGAQWVEFIEQGPFEAYREVAFTLPFSKENASKYLRFKHFDENNYFAHVRYTIREMNGKKILHIEEVQSDWFQQGRQFGYVDEQTRKNMVAQKEALLEEITKLTEEHDNMMEDSVRRKQLGSRITRLAEIIKGLEEKSRFAVPEAPFMQGQAWSNLALKRMIAIAVDLGLDGISITDPEVPITLWKENRVSWEATPQNNQALVKFGNGDWHPVFSRTDLRSALAQELKYYRNSSTISNLVEKIWPRGKKPEGSGSEPIRGNAFKKTYGQMLPKALQKLGGNQAEFTLDAGEEVYQVKGIEITPELREKYADGQSYFQEQGRQGSIVFKEDSIDINLYKDNDLSTLIHEFGHLFLETFGQAFEGGMLGEVKQEDMQKLFKWFKIKSWKELKRNHHEMFAEAFERYVEKGKPPREELRGAFQTFQYWMNYIYKNLKKDNRAALPPEVAAVMDRMLASQEAIDRVNNEFNFNNTALLEELKKIDPKKAAEYARLLADAQAEAEQELTGKLTEGFFKAKNELMKKRLRDLQDQVRRELNDDPVYRAISILTTGKNPDGTESFLGKVKLSKNAIIDFFGEEFIEGLQQYRPYVYTTKPEGIHPEHLAEILGFVDGADMLDSIINQEKLGTRVERVARQRLEEQFAVDEDMVPQLAREYVANEKRAEVLAFEMEILASKYWDKFKKMSVGLQRAFHKRANLKRLKNQAAQILLDTPVMNIKPNAFANKMVKYGKDAEKLKLDGDIEGAINAKEKEVLNFILYKEAIKAKQKAESVAKMARKAGREKAQKRIGKGSLILQDLLNDILVKYNFDPTLSTRKILRKKSLMKYMTELQDSGLSIPANLDEALGNDTRVSYKEITYGHLLAVGDSIKSILHQSTQINKLKGKRGIEELEKRKKSMIDSVLENFFPGEESIPSKPADPNDDKVNKINDMASFLSAHWKIWNITRQMDGHKDFGHYFTNIFLPIKQAQDLEEKMFKEKISDLEKIFSVYSRKERGMWPVKNQYFKGINNKLNFTQVLTVALNWGNVDNRIALMEGYKWNEEQVQEILDTLTKKDWDMIQQTWDLIESLWPEVKSLEERVNGLAPEKVEAAPVQTKFGVYRGGYYPIIYSSILNHDIQQMDTTEKVQDMMDTYFGRAMTKHDHTKKRKGGRGRAVTLNISGLADHFHTVIHDLTHREAILDVGKFVYSDRIRGSIIAVLGPLAYKQIPDWLSATARDTRSEVTNDFGNLIAGLRHNTTIVQIAMKASTALLQPLGYTVSIKELGYKYAWKGVREFYGRRTHWWGALTGAEDSIYSDIKKKSVFMRNRPETFDRDIREKFRHFMLGDFKPITGKDYDSQLAQHIYDKSLPLREAWLQVKTRMGNIGTEKIQLREATDVYFKAVGYMDMAVAIPTWIGAYEKALAGDADNIKAGDEKAAIEYADHIVNITQGSGRISDLAKIQRGTDLHKILTLFFSYFSNLGNQMQSSFAEYKFDKDALKAANAAMMLWVVPFALEKFIMGNWPNPDEDEDAWGDFAYEMAIYPLQSIVGIRDLVRMWGKYGYQFSPVVGTLETIGSGAGAIAKGALTDEELTEKDIQDIVVGSGYLFGWPSKQGWITGSYLYNYYMGYEHPEDPIEFGKGLLLKGATKERER